MDRGDRGWESKGRGKDDLEVTNVKISVYCEFCEVGIQGVSELSILG